MTRDYKSKGIILKQIKYGETSIITDIYTRERGMRSFVVNGVRSKSKSKKAAHFKPMNLVEFVGYEKDEQKLGRIKDIRPYYLYQNLYFDVIKSSVAMLLCECSRNAISEPEAYTDLYDFLETWFITLDQTTQKLGLFPHLFLIKFSSFLGFEPNNNFTDIYGIFDLYDGVFKPNSFDGKYIMTGENSSFLDQILRSDLGNIGDLRIPKNNRNAILEDLIKYYTLHLPHFSALKTLPVLRQIMA